MAYNPPIGNIYHLYTTYIYHLLGEPETTIESTSNHFRPFILPGKSMFLTPAEQTLYDMKMKNVNEVTCGQSFFELKRMPKNLWKSSQPKKNAPPKFNIAPEN